MSQSFHVCTIFQAPLTFGVINPHCSFYRPTIGPLALLLEFMPFFAKIGPAWLRRKAIEKIPIERIQKSINISDTLDKTVRAIMESKKAALAAGDEAVTLQIGEGKDIISVLSTCRLSAKLSRLLNRHHDCSEIANGRH